MGASEFLLRAFHTSRPFWMKFGVGDLHQTPLSKLQVCKSSAQWKQYVVHLMAQTILCAYRHTLRQIGVKFGTGCVCINIFGNCEFRENRHSDCRTVLRGLIMFVLTFPHLFFDLDHLWYKRSACNVHVCLWLSEKLGRRTYFAYGDECNFIYTCTIQVYDAF